MQPSTRTAQELRERWFTATKSVDEGELLRFTRKPQRLANRGHVRHQLSESEACGIILSLSSRQPSPPLPASTTRATSSSTATRNGRPPLPTSALPLPTPYIKGQLIKLNSSLARPLRLPTLASLARPRTLKLPSPPRSTLTTSLAYPDTTKPSTTSPNLLSHSLSSSLNSSLSDRPRRLLRFLQPRTAPKLS